MVERKRRRAAEARGQASVCEEQKVESKGIEGSRAIMARSRVDAARLGAKLIARHLLLERCRLHCRCGSSRPKTVAYEGDGRQSQAEVCDMMMMVEIVIVVWDHMRLNLLMTRTSLARLEGAKEVPVPVLPPPSCPSRPTGLTSPPPLLLPQPSASPPETNAAMS